MEERTVRFKIAKRMTKPSQGAAGLTLRSVQLEEGAAEAGAVLLGQDYSQIKTQVESFRLSTGLDLHFRARGKSLELTSGGSEPAAVLFRFLGTLGYNTDDVTDVVEFCGKIISAETEPKLNILAVALSPEEFILTVETNILGEGSADSLYEVVSEQIAPYDMGIVKETPGLVDGSDA